MSLSKLLGNQETSMDLVDTSRASSSDDICKKEKKISSTLFKPYYKMYLTF